MSTTEHTIAAYLHDPADRQNASGASAEVAGAVWVDFGDGGFARWAGLSLAVLDKVCSQLETVKPADTIT